MAELKTYFGQIQLEIEAPDEDTAQAHSKMLTDLINMTPFDNDDIEAWDEPVEEREDG